MKRTLQFDEKNFVPLKKQIFNKKFKQNTSILGQRICHYKMAPFNFNFLL